MKTTQIKSLGNRRIGGYGILFGDENHPDLENQFFTKDTYFWLDVIEPGGTLFDHTMTPLPEDVKSVMLEYPTWTDRKAIWEEARKFAATRPPQRYKVGKVDKYYADEVGIFFECVLDEHNDYADYVLDLVDMGVMGYSTDSITHLIQTEKQANGTEWIKSWAIPMISATHHPAEPRNLISTIKHVLTDEELVQLFEQTNGAQKAALQRVLQQRDSETNQQKEKTMALNVTTDAMRLKYAQVFLRDQMNEADFKAIDWSTLAVKATDEAVDEEENADKQGSNELETLVIPMAEQFAATFGGTVEEAVAIILQAGIARQQAAAPAEMVEEPATFETEATMASPVKTYDPAKVKAAMGNYLTKNVTPLRRDPDKAPNFARFIKAVMRPNLPDNANFLQKYHRTAEQAWKAQGIEPDSAGGYLTTPEKNGEVVELLRAESVVSNMVRTIPMNTGKLIMPRLDTGATVNNTAENAEITESEAEFGNLEANAIKLSVLVKFSSEIMEDSDPDIEAVIREDIARAVAEKLDTQILRGTGTTSQLRGLMNRSGIHQEAISAGTLAYTDLTQCQQRLEEGNVKIDDRVQWLLDPKGKRIVRELEDGTGRLIFTGGGEGTQAAGRVPDYLLDYTWRQSNLLVPAGTSARNIFLAQWQDIILGMRKQIEFKASEERGFEFDQVWLRAILRVALLVRHDESVQILTGITSRST